MRFLQKWIARPLLGYQFKVKLSKTFVRLIYFMAVCDKTGYKPAKMTKVMTSVAGIRHNRVGCDN